MSFKASIQDHHFLVSKEQSTWTVDNVPYTVLPSDDQNLIYLKDEQGNRIEAIIQNIDADKKMVTLLIQQKEVTIEIQDAIDQRMLALGIDTKKLSKAKNIKAPMPGLILKTLVTEGQEVKNGEPLFILEAMKMENVFKAPDDVRIKKILINEGQTVDKNQELIVFA